MRAPPRPALTDFFRRLFLCERQMPLYHSTEESN
jgi:hypothetical protein